jgi:hypothetical protein
MLSPCEGGWHQWDELLSFLRSDRDDAPVLERNWRQRFGNLGSARLMPLHAPRKSGLYRSISVVLSHCIDSPRELRTSTGLQKAIGCGVCKQTAIWLSRLGAAGFHRPPASLGRHGRFLPID